MPRRRRRARADGRRRAPASRVAGLAQHRLALADHLIRAGSSGAAERDRRAAATVQSPVRPRIRSRPRGGSTPRARSFRHRAGRRGRLHGAQGRRARSHTGREPVRDRPAASLLTCVGESLTAGCASVAEHAVDDPDEQEDASVSEDEQASLYGGYGGTDGVTVVVAELYERILDDPELAPFFAGVGDQPRGPTPPASSSSRRSVDRRPIRARGAHRRAMPARDRAPPRPPARALRRGDGIRGRASSTSVVSGLVHRLWHAQFWSV